jgi:hypothetical protein
VIGLMQMTKDAYQQAWSALGAWIQSCLQKGHGAVIPNLGQVSLVEEVHGGKRIMRPKFQVSSAFAQKYSCRPAIARAMPSACNLCKVNPTALAAQHAKTLNRNKLEDGLKQIIQEIGYSTASCDKVLLSRLFWGVFQGCYSELCSFCEA